MMRIKQLSASVVNQIAAGEVIERPASVVKELVENALDAGATRVDVSVAQGGREAIRVVDNGRGIAADDLPMAVASHATSKLDTADDLFHIRTLGFRGEALASIASVSRLALRSRAVGESVGSEIEVVAGESHAAGPCGCPEGTACEVSQLFFNTPVRRKFLRATQTEMGHVSEAFTRLALAYPEVHFTLRHNDRPVYDLPATERWLDRIVAFFGDELAGHLIWVESCDVETRLSGYVADPSQSRSHPRMQYLFLNGRCIRDRSLQHALREAYRGLLLTGRHPISFLRFEMAAELIDVNVHPTKMEVRFQDGGRLYSQLLGTLRTKFLTTDLTHRLDPAGAASSASNTQRAAMPPSESGDFTDEADPAKAMALRGELVDWAKGQMANWPSHGSGSDSPTGGEFAHRHSAQDVAERSARPLDLTRLARPWRPSPEPDDMVPPEPRADDEWSDRAEARSESPSTAHAGFGAPADRVAAMQIHNRYLVVEASEGVVLIDQHALHERILYEQLREKVLSGALETQNLLVPEPVDLSGPEAALVLEHRELLAQLGLDVEPFGGHTVVVSSYPAMLARSRPGEVLRDVVEGLVEGAKLPDRRDMIDHLLHMMSCKAAIKAGDRLTQEEIAALLEQRHLAQDSHHCPHGRPTALVFTREELDKQFRRI